MYKTYKIGDILKFDNLPESEVIGIDRYRLNSLAGVPDRWVSYTVVSKEEGIFARWWVVHLEGKEYMMHLCERSEVKGTLDDVRSGLAVLETEGDAINASPYSCLVILRDGKDIYCLETFEGSNDVLCMKGVVLS